MQGVQNVACVQVLLCVWQLPVLLPIAFYLVFATLEATFLSATAEKIPTGGWFSLMMSAIYTTIMLLWWVLSSLRGFLWDVP